MDFPASELNIAVIGTGISGMAAAWLLSQRHRVTVFEQDCRIGGHANTVMVDRDQRLVAVDTGFIVYNETNYPNLTALFRHFDVPTRPTEMSFAVSMEDGAFEYGGGSLGALFAQKRNILRPQFWSMLRDLNRFFRDAPSDLGRPDDALVSLGRYLDQHGYGEAFQQRHLLPMAAAIWSASATDIRAYPAHAIIRFYQNHGLLKFTDRPIWRTVIGGSATYVAKLTQSYAPRIRIGIGATRIRRLTHGVEIRDSEGELHRFNHVVIATHADQALSLLDDPRPQEASLLGAFRYARNLAVLHGDDSFMPRRRKVWSSWNHVQRRADPMPETTYWMNLLQGLTDTAPLFVTLNPQRMPKQDQLLRREWYEHPQFDAGALRAQRHLSALQGVGHTWFCGAYFGAGFHEDGLSSGLAVAERLGGVPRPWRVPPAAGWDNFEATRDGITESLMR
jgi:predicted NAD/FAD-binding protein